MFKTSELYLANLNATEDLIINQGGTSSGKTIAILQALFSIAIREKCDILVVGQSIPNLKGGALKDALDIIDSSEELKQLIVSFNKTDREFVFRSGSTMIFKSFQSSQDARSGKRDYTFFNELNGIIMPIFTEIALMGRTKIRTWVDYNPNEEFYIHEFIGKPNVKYLRTWHEHNPFLSQKIRDKIEGLKDIDEELWKVYARGLTGKIEGLVFRKWKVAMEVPEGATYLGSALDFGFTNDPSAAVDVYKSDGDLYVKETLYRTGLTNQDLAKELDHSNKYVCDSAEPKSIEELRRSGLKVEAAQKGKDSVNASIDVLKQYNIYLIGENLVKEFRSYKWKVDKKTNQPINEPVDFMNHLIDALRYFALNKLRKTGSGKYYVY
jgi:phage terminase large subunit